MGTPFFTWPVLDGLAELRQEQVESRRRLNLVQGPLAERIEHMQRLSRALCEDDDGHNEHRLRCLAAHAIAELEVFEEQRWNAKSRRLDSTVGEAA